MIPAIVVLFKPSPDVYQNIKTYLDKVACLYVVDNSPAPSSVLGRLMEQGKVELLSSSRNIGIAEAYNLGLESAHRDGYHWLMTMDQDSSFKLEQLECFFEAFAEVKKDNLSLYAPLHNPKFLSGEGDKPVVAAMSSGSIVNVNTALKVGAFDTALFIDEVDHEFCLHIQQKGYAVIQNSRVFVNHSLGKTEENGKKKYSATRLYYMTRNHLYIKKKYYHLYPDYFKKRLSYMRRFLIGQILHHEHKFHRTVMIFAGIKDCCLKKMGMRYEF